MRADLLALTPESVAALANLGLVKRALREIEQGKGPALAEEADGTVVGTFDDGAVARLVPGRGLRDCGCSCGASSVCRHRVAVALAYRSFVESASIEPAPAIEEGSWSPGEIDDDAIAGAIPRRTLDEAKAAARRGVVIEIVRPVAGEAPIARLPSCTVRFLVPRDLVYARCDCAAGQGCAHIALAAWGFRVADAIDRARSPQTVEVRQGVREAAGEEGAGAAALALALDLVAGGVVHAREALAQRFVLAREPLVAAGHTWTATALDDLELALERYRARSARYRAGDVLALAAEIVARGRSSRSPTAELPASSVLGRGEVAETRLDHLRLIGLGCRFDGDDRERFVEILLADPDTGTVLVMEKTWTFAAGETMPDAPELARRRVGAGAIALLAKGQLVTRVARRRANRVLVLGASTHGSSSLTPQTGDFSLLPTPLRIDRIAELETRFASRPPRLLRPRVRAEDVHAIRVGAIEEVVFDASEQTLVARVRDPEGTPFLIRRAHRRIAPRALDELGRVLLGAHGEVRWVAGEVRAEGSTFVVEPTLVVAERVVVPDVEDSGAFDLPRGRVRAHRDRVGERLDAAWSALEELAQLGIRGTTAAHGERLEAAASGLAALGMGSITARVQRAALEVARARGGDEPDALRAAAGAIVDAAIRLELAREAHR